MHKKTEPGKDFQVGIVREQVNLALRDLPTMQLASFVVALVLAYAARAAVPRTHIVVWIGMVLAIVLSRIVFYFRYPLCGRRGAFSNRLPERTGFFTRPVCNSRPNAGERGGRFHHLLAEPPVRRRLYSLAGAALPQMERTLELVGTEDEQASRHRRHSCLLDAGTVDCFHRSGRLCTPEILSTAAGHHRGLARHRLAWRSSDLPPTTV